VKPQYHNLKFEVFDLNFLFFGVQTMKRKVENILPFGSDWSESFLNPAPLLPAALHGFRTTSVTGWAENRLIRI